MVNLVHRSQPKPNVSQSVRRRLARRIATTAWLVVLIPLLAFFGCAPLEPMAEPELSDLQLTVETLKTAIRDAQRSVTELRTEIESRRRELAESQVARAQLEGRVREAERRLVEARQVVELQREELSAARNERERIARTGQQLHSQMKKLQRQLTDMSGRQQGQADTAPTSMPTRPATKVPANPVRMESASGPQVRPGAARALPATPNITEPGLEQESSLSTEALQSQLRRVSVRTGDTLWSIAQRNHVDLGELRALNKLADNRILPGQVLWLPAPRASVRAAAEPGITPSR